MWHITHDYHYKPLILWGLLLIFPICDQWVKYGVATCWWPKFSLSWCKFYSACKDSNRLAIFKTLCFAFDNSPLWPLWFSLWTGSFIWLLPDCYLVFYSLWVKYCYLVTLFLIALFLHHFKLILGCCLVPHPFHFLSSCNSPFLHLPLILIRKQKKCLPRKSRIKVKEWQKNKLRLHLFSLKIFSGKLFLRKIFSTKDTFFIFYFFFNVWRIWKIINIFFNIFIQ